MIDYSHLEKYRENNRIEAKTALGGLPESMWETYSAFANTLGGIILLGVIETDDKTFRAVGLPDPEGLVSDIKTILSECKRVSANVLSEGDIRVRETGGRKFIAVIVPQADRRVKPVYIDGDPRKVYRRSGEGDYRCTDEEYEAMARDSGEKTPDTAILENMSLGSFCAETVGRYVKNVASSASGSSDVLKRRAAELAAKASGTKPGCGDAETAITDFLICVGAADVGSDSGIYPTSAGLLMFGDLRSIMREYPDYSLEYQERDEDGNITYRISTDGNGPARGNAGSAGAAGGSDAGFSGNIYDFYLLTSERLGAGSGQFGGAVLGGAVRDALVNCLVNADYLGTRGVLIVKKKKAVTFSNPGGFRIRIEAAKGGGASDPRNSAVLRMFTLSGDAENSGSGLKNIFSVWNGSGLKEPVIEETFGPERVRLSLSFSDASSDKADQAQKNSPSGSSGSVDGAEASRRTKKLIIDYLTYHVTGVLADLADYAGVTREEANLCLEELVSEGFVVSGLERGKIRYRLRS